MEEINLDSLDMTPSSDFGGGVEFLMNDKMTKGDKGSSDNNLYVSLEDELKELDNFGTNNSIPEIKPIRMNLETKEPVLLGKDTISVDTFLQSKEAGFRHLNDINIENEIKNIEVKTKEDLAREKFEILRKLEAYEDAGVKLSRHYSIESPLEEMRGELEYLNSERERKSSVALQAKILSTLITGVEFLNNKFDPFDVNLDGWAESINDNINDFDDVFSELHEKYKSKAKMAPEMKLLLQLVTSGITVTVANRFKSAIPGMDEIMRQNPDLMNHFTQAAVKSMETSKPGFSNFMGAFGPQQQQSQNRQPMPTMPTMPQYNSPQPNSASNLPPRHPQREEMKGPEIKNINSVLAGLNKKINMEENNESTVSIDDLDTHTFTGLNAVSKKGRRRSDKSMTLNI
jgi:hypothetical protein